jgi:hypothetical protein
MQRRGWIVAVMLGVAVAACSKTEAPTPATPAPKAEAPKPIAAPAVNEELKRLAAEVYVFAYPLVLTDVTRQVETAKSSLNVFEHRRSVPDVSAAEANPNADVLYSQAWLDLSKEPVLLSVPDTKGRYWLIAMLDAWSNVAASLGPRTVGEGKQEIAIVGPRWKGTLPAGVSEVKSPTEMAWLLGRMQADRKSEQAAVAKLQDQTKLGPLTKSSRAAKGSSAAPTHEAVDVKTAPREQVAKMDAATFLTRVAMLLPGNPPTKADAPMVDKIKKLGIVGGQPFDLAKLDALSATSVEAGVKSAHDAIEAAGKRSGSAELRNGWMFDRELGRWGTDYGKRAVVAWRGLGANAPEDAIFMTAHFDSGGQRLDGAQRYVLHFDKGAAPPTEAFWSVSLYDEKQHFAANPLGRYHIGSDDNLRTNPDGSVDVYIQNADPGKDKESNWLPAPKGSFYLILRVYWPKEDVVNGRWVPPGIRRVA